MNLTTTSLDLTPFNEPVEIEIQKWGLGGYQVKCKVKINRRWDTECEYLEANRVFGHKGDLDETELKKEFAKAIADIHEKRLWVFQANHGLLDTKDKTVRFKA